MNTKTLLLVLFFILFVPAKVSIGSSNQSREQHTDLVYDNYGVNPLDANDATAVPWGIALNNTFAQSSHTNHNSDDDGKSHNFHYTRLQKRRGRNIWCLIAKLVLLVTHVSSFLACFAHISH